MATLNTALDPLFGIHGAALAVQRKRMDVIASNLANADTPNYQARDIDFAKVLSQTRQAGQGSATSLGGAGLGMTATQAGHIAGQPTDAAQNLDPALLYRVPLQPSLDGNTVDTQIEQGKFLDAALHYQASLDFITGQVKGLTTAITGQ